MAFDYKKYKQFYIPKNQLSIVEVPKMNYIDASRLKTFGSHPVKLVEYM